MGKQKKHIDLFEELIRIVSLKTRFDSHLMDSLVDSVDRNSIPEKIKSDKLIDELEAHYFSKKPRRKFPLILWVILLFVIFVGIFVLTLEKRTDQKMQQKTEVNQTISDSDIIREIPENKVTKIDTIHAVEKIIKDTFVSNITQIETEKIDTVTVEKPVTIIDTVPEKKLIPAFSPKKAADTADPFENDNCFLPEFFSISFSQNSSNIVDSYENDLKEIAGKIIRCQNIKTIEINAFYTRRFLIFSNKKLVSERVERTTKTLKRNGVTIKMLRAKKVEFIRIPKNEYSEPFEKVEILLDN